ncbi:uncharacterized protein LOC6739757 [Drosophila simulans]|uniref:uncharacterized protein LOC6739757 n=1 Tax=Drosophila simulans TaxID=7240 RepID=UPI00078AE67B|nr:uncharacterized protein LOC6739757 [Drosophila simulans]KMZ05047.1 uncharacterized protein Dsimw501_GD17955 [Drosophila simulans]
MSLIFNLLFILLLSQAVSQETEFPQLKYLNKLVRLMIKRHKMETLVIVKHHLDYNCTLQNWNVHGMGIIRTNDQGKIRMRDTFNSRTLAIICIGENSHISLLRSVFETFGKVRQQKIILWTQMELKEEFFQEISKKSTDLKLFDMLMLNVVAKDKLLTYRLSPFPSPHFKRIKNIWTPNDYVYMDTKLNFHGMTAVVKHDYNLTIQMGNIKKFPISRIEDKEVFEFALKYNLTLQFFNDVDWYDIELRKRIILTNNSTQPIDYGMPMSFPSLLIVVPCGHYLSIQDVIKVSGIQKWIFYIILVYVIFVLFEITFLKVSILISRQSHHQKIPNSLVNLCAFRAILGLPFPETRRSSLSLRQLFLAIVLFGMIFSIFINCKLSSMLTKPSARPQVNNFEELKTSELTVVMDEDAENFIEKEMGVDFISQYMPRKVTTTFTERAKLLFSLEANYAFTLFSESFAIIEGYQRSKGLRAHCTSEDLIIAERVPRIYILGNNSILDWPLSRFIVTMQESGITNHWIKNIPRGLARNLKEITIPYDRERVDPLSIKHLTWLWCILILGYSISMIAFLVEMSLKRMKRNLENREPSVCTC